MPVSNDKKEQLRTFEPRPSRPPAVVNTGIWAWMKDNLFGSVWNTLLTVSIVCLLYFLFKPFLQWALFEAVWEASSRRECLDTNPEGACWPAVIHWTNGLVYGRYPIDQQWRVDLGMGIGFLWLLPLALKRTESKIIIGVMAVVLYPFLASYLFLGGHRGIFHLIMACLALSYLLTVYLDLVLSWVGKRKISSLFEPLAGKFSIRHAKPISNLIPLILLAAVVCAFSYGLKLEYVTTDRWGGLFLTLIISGFAIVMALPIGILLALGRRSQLPVVKWYSIAIIELVRSVPMITVLFMSVTMMPLFFPNTIELNKLVQVIIAVCIFSGAYMAETVRGGLQSIPRGQFDAARAVGFGYWHSMILIILPQALKAMIPNIITSFISLFKDTTLVSIIGLFDIMLMARNISIDKDWFGLHSEPLVAISILFFLVCYCMSQYSMHLEKKLRTD